MWHYCIVLRICKLLMEKKVTTYGGLKVVLHLYCNVVAYALQ